MDLCDYWSHFRWHFSRICARRHPRKICRQKQFVCRSDCGYYRDTSLLERYNLIPIVESLIEKGLPVGTALAFLMSVSGISLPEIIILKRVLKNKLIGVFVLTITVSIIFMGYLFNIIL